MQKPAADSAEMFVVKRTGKTEIMKFDKILNRIKKSGEEAGIQKLNYTALTIKIIDQLYDKIPTTQIDELTAQQCYSMTSVHPDYGVLAARIIHSNHQRSTSESFYHVMTQLYKFTDKQGKAAPMLSEQAYGIVRKYRKELEAMIVHERDYLIDYFGFKTLERAYLMRINKKIVERIQHMWLRVSIGVHGEEIDKVKETYDAMSQKWFIHATPTLFNAGTPRPQLSSCFLLAMEDDSIDGIFNTLRDCAFISKWGGGIGLHAHNIRAKGSHIRGTNGQSNGLVPLLRVFNNTAKYVDQCFTPDTIVWTDAGPKAIEDVGTTDRVLTSTGKFHSVIKPVRHEYDGPMLTIRTKYASVPVRTTPEHQVMALQGMGQEVSHDVIRSQLEKGYTKPAFYDAKDLSVGDLLVFPVPQVEEKDIEQLSLDDCRFYGMMVGCGNMTNQTAGLSLNTKGQPQVVEFVRGYFSKRGIRFSEDTKHYEDPEHQMYIGWSIAQVGFTLTRPQLYGPYKEKRVDPAFLHLPLDKVRQVVQGILETTTESSRCKLLQLRESFGYMQLRMGPTCSDSVLCHGNYIYTRIDDIQETTYAGIVHDFEIDGPHDYTVAHLGIVHNGGGKRNGSFAIYLEPWHADIQAFLQMKKNHGDEEQKGRDLFYALWISDLFMERMHNNGTWTLMCPDECPGLADVWGDDFVQLYERYEREGKGRETIQARDLWIQILDAQMETGTPYLLYKDACNRKSNQQNVGTIKSSNLCTEIIEYSDANESAVCNLASISLPAFVKGPTEDKRSEEAPSYDFEALHRISKMVAYNLNKVIDVNYYPTEKTERSNFRHRPVGVGVQGLADVFMQLRYPYDSPQAKELNRLIFETIYHAALEQSCELAKRYGPYETFAGSPASQGQLQFDLWSTSPTEGRYDWASLKEDIKEYGLRNSLLLAPMPTASTSQILGNNECFEPITSNLYSRGTNAGQFLLANKYLQRDLIQLGLWSEALKNKMVANNGSIQALEEIPEEVRQRYKTVWEIPQKVLIDMAVDRGAFICQSQSLNLWLEDPTYKSLTTMHYYSWKQGLKTGIYYLRRRARHQAQKFTIEPTKVVKEKEEEVCDMCSA